MVPDVESQFETLGLTLSGLEIEYTEQELLRAAREPSESDELELRGLAEYFRARSVIATVAFGAHYGSTAKFIANFAVWDNQGDSDSFPIVTASDAGTLTHGQETEAFVKGLAYAYQRTVVADDEVRYFPTNDEPEYLEHGNEVSKSIRVLTVAPGAKPHTAYGALLPNAAIGHYGLTKTHQVILPGPLWAGAAEPDLPSEPQLPTIDFIKSGKVRRVSVDFGNSSDAWMILTSSSPYMPVAHYPQGSKAHDVSTLLAQPVTREYSDKAPTHRSFFEFFKKAGTSDRRATHYFATLAEHGDKLTAVRPEVFFSRVGKVLGLPQDILEVIEAFEELDTQVHEVRSDRSTSAEDQAILRFSEIESLAGIPLTPVAGIGLEPNRRVISKAMSVDHLLSSYANDPSEEPNILRRLRRNPVLGAALSSIAGIIAIALLVGAVTNILAPEIEVFDRVLLGIGALIVGALGVQLAAVTLSLKYAKSLLQQAREDGVFTFKE